MSRPRRSLHLALLLLCSACDSTPPNSEMDDLRDSESASAHEADASGRVGDAGDGDDTRPASDAATQDPSLSDADGMPLTDAGQVSDDRGDAGADGAVREPGDAGTQDDPDAAVGDAGSLQLGPGSCCAEHTTAGCSNADLMVCVCERLPSCCTEAWGPACVLIVQQKYCQPGVRECVCGSEDGQWQQATCCNVSWTESFCDQVAETNCGAQPGCV